MLHEIGYETLSEMPILDASGSINRTLYNSADERRHAAAMKADEEYAEMYGQSLSILEAKQWDADFTKRFSERRSYRDASHQPKFYLADELIDEIVYELYELSDEEIEIEIVEDALDDA